jgi:hypothetical protein
VESPDQIPTPFRYPPRRTPLPPHLKAGIVKCLRMRTTWSLSGAGGDRGCRESRPNPDSTPLSSSPNSSPSSSKQELSNICAFALHGLSQEQVATGVAGSPDQIPTPIRYPPRQTPLPPHLKTGIVQWLSKHANHMVSLRSRRRQWSVGARTKPRLHSAILLAKLLTLLV